MSKKEKMSACPVRKTSIGGQALMEGIMMRGPRVTAMAVRDPQGEIVLEKFPTSSGKRPWPWRVPVIRGVFNFVDSMIFGYKCLMRSAEISGLEEAEEEMRREKEQRKAAKAAKKGSAVAETEPEAEPVAETETTAEPQAEPVSEPEPVPENEPVAGSPAEKKKTSPLMIGVTVISVVFALALAIGLFVYLPTLLYDLLADHVSWIRADDRYLKSIFTGILKIILLVGYMAAVSLMKDIRRTFQYHGAEHKTIFCYEAGLPLTVENVRKMRRFHPRCGTSFLILMLLVSILVGFFIPPTLDRWLYSGIKILLVPVICGLGYELIKFCGRHDNWLTRLIAAPGVALQHITVFEPDDSMIECAIAAVKEVIPEDGSDKW